MALRLSLRESGLVSTDIRGEAEYETKVFICSDVRTKLAQQCTCVTLEIKGQLKSIWCNLGHINFTQSSYHINNTFYNNYDKRYVEMFIHWCENVSLNNRQEATSPFTLILRLITSTNTFSLILWLNIHTKTSRAELAL